MLNSSNRASPRKANRHWMWLVAVGLQFCAPGCKGLEPVGQVIATVNGEEVTLAELNEEARARGITIGTDLSVRDRLLQDIINRKILVQKAITAELDQTPAHLLAKRRTTEILLAQQLIASASASNPGRADSRTETSEAPALRSDEWIRIWVDRISYASRIPDSLRQRLAKEKDLAAIGRLLESENIEYTRALATMDAANSEPELLHRLDAAGVGALVRRESDGLSVVTSVLAIARQPVTPAEQQKLNRQRDVEQRTALAIESLVSDGKRGAEIRYQNGFTPKAVNGRRR